MTGLLLTAFFILWAAMCLSVSYAVGMLWFRSKALVFAVAALGTAVLTPIPILDEIRGGVQFKKICKNRIFDVSQERLRGRTVKLEFPARDEKLSGTVLPILYTRVVLRDVSTAEAVGAFDRYVAKGGWLMQTLKISENRSPLFVGESVCQPQLSIYALANKYNFVIVK